MFNFWTGVTTSTCFWSLVLKAILALSFLPSVNAMNPEQNFPDISFQEFNRFVLDNFGSKVSLSTVLMVLFTMTNNPELLRLHARYQTRSRLLFSGWMSCLADVLLTKLDVDASKLFHKNEGFDNMEPLKKTHALSKKLDDFAKLLKLYPVDKNGQFKGKLKSTSHTAIQPIYIIAPNTPVCLTEACDLHPIHRKIRNHDIAKVCVIYKII